MIIERVQGSLLPVEGHRVVKFQEYYLNDVRKAWGKINK